ncbi:MAG: MscL family protein [Candidatus Saccharimonadales bacterium]
MAKQDTKLKKAPANETRVVEHADGSVRITQPKDKKKRNITILLDEPQDYVREGVGGFVDFLREKAVVGLAVGFIIGQQAQTLIKQFVDSFITPVLNVIVGQDLQTRVITIGSGTNKAQITWGKFIYVLVSFIFVLITIYVVVKFFKLDKLDKPKEPKK